MSNKEYKKPLPNPTKISERFWSGLKNHELFIQQCEKCGEYVFSPRARCRECLSDKLKWVKVSGKATLFTYTTVHRALMDVFETPYVVAYVELEEGPRMMTNIVDCRPEDLKIDMNLEAVFDDVTEDVTLLKFKPLSASSS